MTIRSLLCQLPEYPCERALAWAGTLPPETTPEEAYARCEEPGWLVWLACILDAKPVVLLSAALRVLREIAPHLPQLHKVLADTLAELDAWVAAGGPALEARLGISPLALLAGEEGAWNAATAPARVLAELCDVMVTPPLGELWADPDQWVHATIALAFEKMGEIETRKSVLAARVREALPWTTIAPLFVEVLRPADPREEAGPPR